MRYKEIIPLGDHAILIRLGDAPDRATHEKVRMLTEYLSAHPFEGMIEAIPAYTSVTAVYDPYRVWLAGRAALEAGEAGGEAGGAKIAKTPHELAAERLQAVLAAVDERELPEPRRIEIPVCYGGEYGPDLEAVAELNGLSPDEVVAIHAGVEYLVHMIGFAPAFASLGGRAPRVAPPRKAPPRLSVPPGSVGIAGVQTGIYSVGTPGGWQIIGRTPLLLFSPEKDPPSLLEAGDRVRFRPISREAFKRWGE